MSCTKNLLIITFLFFSSLAVKAQLKLPELPIFSTKNITTKNIDSLLFKSTQKLDKNPINSLSYLFYASKLATINLGKTNIANQASKLGSDLYNSAKYKEAIYFQSLAGHLWFEMDSVKQYSKSLRKLGENYHKLGDIYSSLKYLNEAKKISEKYNFQYEKYYTYIALAWSYRQVGNFNESEKYILLSKLMIDDKTIIANNYEYYYLYSLLNRTKARYTLKEQYNTSPLEISNKNNSFHLLTLAMKYNDSSIMVAKKIGDIRLLAKAISNKANFLIYAKGNIDTIIEKISYAIKINHQMDDKHQLASNYGILSKAYLYDKDYLKNIEAANKALKYAKETGDLYEVANKYDLLKYGYNEIGDYKKAFFYSEKHNALYKEVYGFKDFYKIFEIQKKYDEILNTNIIDNLKIKNKQNRQIYWLISIITLLVFSGIVFYYIQSKKNQKQKNEIHKKQLSYELLQMEMTALRSRMNPHFLFNSLNSIKNFITQNASREASNYLSKFATLVRMILDHSKEKVISLNDELKAIQYYIDIEKMRLKNMFEYNLVVDKTINTNEILIPPSILQPFVENSIWHGFANLKEKGVLLIRVFSENNAVIIEIEDNGIGRKEARLLKLRNSSYRSVGISIIKEMVEVFNNENIITLEIKTIDLFTTEKKSKGTKVILAIKEA